MTVNVEVRRADISSKPVVFNLLQIYLHTFAVLAKPGDPQWRFNAFGQFDYPGFNSYWTDKNRHPYLIYAGGDLAGFALVNDWSASGRKTGFYMAEFFIGGQYRRRGAGKKAAGDIFRHHPGIWELGVLAGNDPAVAFWAKTLEDAGVDGLETFAGDGKRFNGAIFRFSA